jgi:hypothetical protein
MPKQKHVHVVEATITIQRQYDPNNIQGAAEIQRAVVDALRLAGKE